MDRQYAPVCSRAGRPFKFQLLCLSVGSSQSLTNAKLAGAIQWTRTNSICIDRHAPNPKKNATAHRAQLFTRFCIIKYRLDELFAQLFARFCIIKKIQWIILLRCVKQLLQLTVQVLTSYLPIRYYQTQASPKCHYGNGLRHYAIFSSSALHQTFRPLVKSRRQQPITTKKACSSRTC